MVMRRGAASLGCLGWLLIVAAVVYVGYNVGQPYYRYYRFRDVVSQQVRFASFRTDEAIRKDIVATADSLDLPEEAYHVNIARTQGVIRVRGAYDDYWTLWKYTRPAHFSLNVQGGL